MVGPINLPRFCILQLERIFLRPSHTAARVTRTWMMHAAQASCHSLAATVAYPYLVSSDGTLEWICCFRVLSLFDDSNSTYVLSFKNTREISSHEFPCVQLATIQKCRFPPSHMTCHKTGHVPRQPCCTRVPTVLRPRMRRTKAVTVCEHVLV